MSAYGLPIAPAVARALDRFQESLERTFGNRLREFVLYGSQARGTANEESDVDVLIVIDELSERERVVAIDLAYDANAVEREIWVGISPLVHSSQTVQELRSRERLIMRNVAQDGIWLHGAPSEDSAELHA